MAEAKILRIYLDPIPLAQVEAGNFNFFDQVRAAFQGAGFRVEFRKNSDVQRLKSASRRGYSLFLMDEPFHPKALTVRKAYYYPFWRIENTAKRWEFQVAKAPFDAAEVAPERAKLWADNWRKWLFKGMAEQPEKEGFVYVPLQGRLLNHRSFQTMSPIEMLRSTLAHDPARRVVAGLHPGETYTSKERAALDEVVKDNARLTLQSGGMEAALRGCDYVVTQNSTAALSGFFFQKPAVLFAKADFHHIAANVADLGEKAAFETVHTMGPAYDQYLYWFIQKMAIKADEPGAQQAILDTVRARGWVV